MQDMNRIECIEWNAHSDNEENWCKDEKEIEHRPWNKPPDSYAFFYGLWILLHGLSNGNLGRFVASPELSISNGYL